MIADESCEGVARLHVVCEWVGGVRQERQLCVHCMQRVSRTCQLQGQFERIVENFCRIKTIV